MTKLDTLLAACNPETPFASVDDPVSVPNGALELAVAFCLEHRNDTSSVMAALLSE